MSDDTPASILFPIGSPVSPGHIAERPREAVPSENRPHKVPPRRPPVFSAPASDGGVTIFPAHLFDRPNSVLVYGPSRPLVNLTLYALAEATTPEFHWLDIGVPGEERAAADPVQLGWIPEDRLWLVDRPEALRPDDLTANLALFGLIRSDEPTATLNQLTEFLRLPETSQRILSVRPNDGRPGALAVTNAHRVMAAYPPHRVPPILALHINAGFSVLVGYADSAGPGRSAFDFVFHLDGPSISEWRKSHLVCEKGITSGPLRDGRPVALEEIPGTGGRLVQRDVLSVIWFELVSGAAELGGLSSAKRDPRDRSVGPAVRARSWRSTRPSGNRSTGGSSSRYADPP